MSERGTLAYLYWPTAAAVLMTIGCLHNVLVTLGLA